MEWKTPIRMREIERSEVLDDEIVEYFILGGRGQEANSAPLKVAAEPPSMPGVDETDRSRRV